jgi:hypothetical protein
MARRRAGAPDREYRRRVHPIEHLRYVARAHGADSASLATETAHALGSMRFDPSGLVVACRRIVERHPFSGPLWWLCSNVLTSSEPFETVWELADRIGCDETPRRLAAELPDDADVVTIGSPDVVADALVRRGDVRVLALDVGHTATSFVRRLERHDVDYEPIDAGLAGIVARDADVVLVEALATDGVRVVAPVGASTIAACAMAGSTPSWLLAGVGRRLPAAIVDAMVERVDELRADLDAWDLDVEVVPATLFTDVVGPLGRLPMGPPAIVAECPVASELLRRPAM